MDGKDFNKEKWDEYQQIFLLVASFVFWGGFEVMCYNKMEYANAAFTAGIRIVLINLVTNLFTYIYTKSKSGGEQNDTK